MEHPHLRDIPTGTLADLHKTLELPKTTHVVDMGGMKVRCPSKDAIPMVVLPAEGKKKATEVPLTTSLIGDLGELLGVPPKFVLRQDYAFQSMIMNALFERNPGEVAIDISKETGRSVGVYRPHAERYEPVQIVDGLLSIMPPTSTVVEVVSDSGMWQVDVIVPADCKKGIGGDQVGTKGRQVGDITRGGIRCGTKWEATQNHAPWAASYLFRLACTNGMEMPCALGRVDARGRTHEEVLQAFIDNVDTLYDGLEDEIEKFYALRSEKITKDPPDRVFRREVQERGLPIRGQNLDDLSELMLTVEEPTMFDVVGLVTNFANHSSLIGRPSTRRRLEQAGGEMVHESHANRCPKCSTKLVK